MTLLTLHPHERQHFDTLAPGETMTIVRAMVPQPDFGRPDAGLWYPSKYGGGMHYASEEHFRKGVAKDFAPHQPGERVGVGEEWWRGPDGEMHYKRDRGDDDPFPDDWQPADTLPEWAVRQWVTVVGVEGKRISDLIPSPERPITVWRHGIDRAKLWWNKHNPTLPFDRNPWVWVETIRKEGE